jgi:EAL domain-containing protein (putative c-di-GMP-specific phosphodiesterase class I)
MDESVYGNRLLVVDDEPAVGRLVAKVAERLGFEALSTDDPRLFLKLVRSWHPTVIVLDLRIPGTDGVQLLRSLAADRCTAHVVIASGVDEKVGEAALRLGGERGLKMGGILHKPFEIAALSELLGSFRKAPKGLLSNDLAQAIDAGQLFLEFQPQLDCRRSQIVGVESFVRWRHPTRGIIRPAQFVPLAEESGLIVGLTGWVVEAAVAQAAAWHRDGLPLSVAINISARDLEETELPEQIDRHCRDRGVDPAAIILELTETSAMREAVQMMDVLTRLRIKGFKLSIDDFGSGYSSLVQLQQMPFSELKIDRSFVVQMASDKGSRVIVEIIIDLAKKLGLWSVAEGVESAASLETLSQLGCDAVQGDHISVPLAGDQLAAFVRAYNSAGRASGIGA